MALVNFSLHARKKEAVENTFFLFVLASLATYIVSPTAAIVLGLFSALFLVSLYLEWVWYAFLVLVFMHGLEVTPGEWYAFRHSDVLAGINAPLVDFVVIIFFLGLLLSLLFRFHHIATARLARLFPGALLYGGFLLVAFVSSRGAYSHMSALSLRYLLYPMLFVYLGYVTLPLFALQSRRVLINSFVILFFVGLLVSLFGLVGFGMTLSSGVWARAVPFAIGSIAPFGFNHNMIGEILVSIIPLGVYLARIGTTKGEHTVFTTGTIIMVAIALLTLSRTAWIVLALYAVGFVTFFRQEAIALVKQAFEKFPLTIMVGVSAVLIYMGTFLVSPVVSSSNDARFATVEFVSYYARDHFYFGLGPNMFIPVLNDSVFFTQDFGSALDAHGVLLKILFEDGMLGAIFFFGFLGWVLTELYRGARHTNDPLIYTMLFVASGAIAFQFFSTSYFNANMWFPIGLALAGLSLSFYGEDYVS